MAKKTYSEQLRDPRWQKKRLEILQRDKFTCVNCGSEINELNVHHKTYINGRDVWDYPNSLLITLCSDCHSNLHFGRELIDSVLSEFSISQLHTIHNILYNLSSMDCNKVDLFDKILSGYKYMCDKDNQKSLFEYDNNSEI